MTTLTPTEIIRLAMESGQSADVVVASLEAGGWQITRGWQPIETAPKDGTQVLLYEDFEPATCAGSYLEDEWVPSHGPAFWKRPTHWMPLAARPKG